MEDRTPAETVRSHAPSSSGTWPAAETTGAQDGHPEAGSALVTIRVVPLWATRWWVVKSRRAIVLLDGRESTLPWGEPVSLQVRCGVVEVEASSCSRTATTTAAASGARALAERRARLRLRLAAGEQARVTFRQGWISGAPLLPVLAGNGEQWRFDPHGGCYARVT